MGVGVRTNPGCGHARCSMCGVRITASVLVRTGIWEPLAFSLQFVRKHRCFIHVCSAQVLASCILLTHHLWRKQVLGGFRWSGLLLCEIQV